MALVRLAGIVAALLGAACVTATASAPEPQTEIVAQPDPERPSVVECKRQGGPARPLYPAEVFVPFSRGDSIDLAIAQIESIEHQLAEEPDRARRIALLHGLAIRHLAVFEHEASKLCAAERSSSDASTLALRRDQLRARLDAAMIAAATGIELGGTEPSEKTSELLCAHTIAASRLGELERARERVAALTNEAPCTLLALVEYGHAHDRAGAHDQARAVFEQALVIAEQSVEPALACPVVGEDRGYAEIDGIVRPDSFARWCAWAGYLRYRLTWSAHGMGE